MNRIAKLETILGPQGKVGEGSLRANKIKKINVTIIPFKILLKVKQVHYTDFQFRILKLKFLRRISNVSRETILYLRGFQPPPPPLRKMKKIIFLTPRCKKEEKLWQNREWENERYNKKG